MFGDVLAMMVAVGANIERVVPLYTRDVSKNLRGIFWEVLPEFRRIIKVMHMRIFCATIRCILKIGDSIVPCEEIYRTSRRKHRHMLRRAIREKRRASMFTRIGNIVDLRCVCDLREAHFTECSWNVGLYCIDHQLV